MAVAPCLALLIVILADSQADTTDWDSISPKLQLHWQQFLPQPPSQPLVATTTEWPFQRTLLSSADIDYTSPCHTRSQFYPQDAITSAALDCRINVDVGKDVFRFFTKSDPNNVWVRPDGQPTWLMHRFPVPASGLAELITWQLDTRYPRRMDGPVPPACADPDTCQLCLTNETGWDRHTAAGYYVLLAAAGDDGFAVSGPFNSSYVEGKLEVPVAFRTRAVQELSVVIFTYSQYPSTEEASFDSFGRCQTSAGYSIMPHSVGLLTRSQLHVMKVPLTQHPRLFGDTQDWLQTYVQPFANGSCRAGESLPVFL